MSRYEVTWPCCGDTTITDAWEPEKCPFCDCSALEHAAELQAELLTELQLVYERSYNPFEPDNQSEQYKRVGALIAKAKGEAS